MNLRSLIAFACSVFLLAAASMSALRAQARYADAAGVPVAHAATVSVALKPILAGLISMGQVGFSTDNDNARFDGIPGSSLQAVIAKRNAFDGVVINIPWVRIQPNGAGDFVPGPIDDALAQIRHYNGDALTAVPLHAILRVWAGVNAPAWVKELDGGPVTVYVGNGLHRGASMSIGRFWAAGNKQAFRALQQRLAQRYDAEPLIAQISNTSCTSNDDEWNAVPRYSNRTANNSSIRALKAAGYTDAAFLKCMHDSFDDYAGWKATRINLTLGPMFRLDAAGDFQVPHRDTAATIELMHAFRSRFGAAAVLANHNLNNPLLATMLDVYRAISLAGPPIEFQTHSPATLDWPNAVRQAACLGADSLEIWNSTNAGGYIDYSTSILTQWATQLKHRSADAVRSTGCDPAALAPKTP